MLKLTRISVLLWPKSCSSRATHSRLSMDMSMHLLKISKELAAKPLSSLCQCSVAHPVQKCFPGVQRETPVPVRVCSFVLALGPTKKGLALSSWCVSPKGDTHRLKKFTL